MNLIKRMPLTTGVNSMQLSDVFTNNFRVRSTGTGSPYTVSGFYVDFIPAGRT